jgi:hypothetical protein
MAFLHSDRQGGVAFDLSYAVWSWALGQLEIIAYTH